MKDYQICCISIDTIDTYLYHRHSITYVLRSAKWAFPRLSLCSIRVKAERSGENKMTRTLCEMRLTVKKSCPGAWCRLLQRYISRVYTKWQTDLSLSGYRTLP